MTIKLEFAESVVEPTCRPYWNHARPCGPVEGHEEDPYRDEYCACGCEASDIFCEGTPKKDHPYYRGQI